MQVKNHPECVRKTAVRPQKSQVTMEMFGTVVEKQLNRVIVIDQLKPSAWVMQLESQLGERFDEQLKALFPLSPLPTYH